MTTQDPTKNGQEAPNWLRKVLADKKVKHGKDYAFLIDDKDQLTLWDPAYPEKRMHLDLTGGGNLSAPFDMEFLKFLPELKQHEATLTALDKSGYEITRSPSKLFLAKRDDSSVKLMHSFEDDGNLKNFLSLARDKHIANAFADPASIGVGEVVTNRVIRPVVPKDKKVTYVFGDSKPLERLSASRGHGRTWFDLMIASADSPAVAEVVIPSYIADVKMLGRSIEKVEEGNYKFAQFDRDYLPERAASSPRTAHANAWREIVDKATRVHIDEQGNATVIQKGEIPNLIIYDGPHDKDITRHLMSSRNAQAEIAAIERKANNSIGDAAAVFYATKAAIDGPAYIVSNNGKYHDALLEKGLSTKKGHPIGHTSVSGYIGTEVATRPKQIAEDLGIRDIPSRAPITHASIRRAMALNSDIVAATPEEVFKAFNDTDPVYTTPGKTRNTDRSWKTGPELREILKLGLNEPEFAPRLDDVTAPASVTMPISEVTAHGRLPQQQSSLSERARLLFGGEDPDAVHRRQEEQQGQGIFSPDDTFLTTAAVGDAAAHTAAAATAPQVPYVDQRLTETRAHAKGGLSDDADFVALAAVPAPIPAPAVPTKETALTAPRPASAPAVVAREKAPDMINITQKLRGFFVPKDIAQQTALALKNNMLSQFSTPQGDAFTFDEIAAASKLDMKDVSVIMGKGKFLPPINVKDDGHKKADLKSWRTKGDKLATALKELTNDDDKVSTFKAMYKNFLKNVVEFKEMDRGKASGI